MRRPDVRAVARNALAAARARRRRPAAPRLLRAFAGAYPRATFVEIGSNDGEQHDHLRPHILGREWRGVMVEPQPQVFERLQRNYGGLARVALENAAISDRDGTVAFFYPAPPEEDERAQLPDWYDGIGSLSRAAVLSHARDIPDLERRVVEQEVPSLTYPTLLRRHGLDHVDLLVVDTEGHDWEILRRIDLTRDRPRLLAYEHYHLTPGDRLACRRHLERLGYETLEEGFDTFCLLPARDRLTWVFRRLRPAFPGVSAHDEDDRRYLSTLHEPGPPLPPAAEQELRSDHPRLAELRAAYAGLDIPAVAASRWSREAVEDFLDVRNFRGETLITWHYREERRVTALKFFLWLRHVRDRDALGLLDRLGEDGAFGCWTHVYPGHGRVSRDLLESVGEINFLERRLGLSRRERLSVLDVGAGYGRLAHRMTEAFPQLDDYCCVDAVPESTFVSDFYLRHRGCTPPARVVRLDEVEERLAPRSFDLAVNIHSFSECPLAAIAWWARLLGRLEVPWLLVVPNEPEELLSLEPDGSRRDFAPALADAGYRLDHREPVLADPAVEELVGIRDRFFLFARDP